MFIYRYRYRYSGHWSLGPVSWGVNIVPGHWSLELDLGTWGVKNRGGGEGGSLGPVSWGVNIVPGHWSLEFDLGRFLLLSISVQ